MTYDHTSVRTEPQFCCSLSASLTSTTLIIAASQRTSYITILTRDFIKSIKFIFKPHFLNGLLSSSQN
jgi:hypothetical protein